MKTYRIRLNSTPGELVEKASSIAKDNGFNFNGNEENGDFGAMGVEGSYRIANEEVVVTVSSKPFMIPWSMVEKYVQQFFT